MPPAAGPQPPAAPMREALELAQQALYRAAPNPRVGCVIATPAGQVLGRGATQRAGGAHAEIMALRDAHARGHQTAGATAWVTLEPCAHQGRTGPCCDALVQAGIARVVAALQDPNPLVAGRGFARLRAAGVALEVGPGADAARELNLGFFSRMLRARPWVRVKIAASLDAVSALHNGASQWITGPAARADGHAWRARACALLTGSATVLADDPRLDVRAVATERQPALVLVDGGLRVAPAAAIFAAQRPVHIYTASADAARRRALEERGASVSVLPACDSADGAAGGGRVDLAALLRDLAHKQINELHVEAGYRLNGALLRAGLVDELLLYLAPRLLGQGLGLAQLAPLADLAQAQALRFHALDRVGDDLRILARVQGQEAF